jgi:hypothetical protein
MAQKPKQFKDSERYHPVAITPSDSTDLSLQGFRGFMVNVAGNIVLEPVGSTTPLTLAVLAGVEYHIGFDKVNATSTTATGITGLL